MIREFSRFRKFNLSKHSEVVGCEKPSLVGFEEPVKLSARAVRQYNKIDSDYKKDLSVKEGIELAKKCIHASFGRDPASGGGMDIYIVKKDRDEIIIELYNSAAFELIPYTTINNIKIGTQFVLMKFHGIFY